MEQNWRGEAGKLQNLLVAVSEDLVSERDARVQEDTDIRKDYRAFLNDERTLRLKMAQEQRLYVDDQDRKLALLALTFMNLGFWNRMRWIVGLKLKL